MNHPQLIPPNPEPPATRKRLVSSFIGLGIGLVAGFVAWLVSGETLCFSPSRFVASWVGEHMINRGQTFFGGAVRRSSGREAALLSELRELEVELHRATARGSRERLEQLLHPDFTEVGKSGRCYTRDAIIKQLLAEGERPDVWSGEFCVLRLGDSAALLTYRSAHVGAGADLANRARRASIWSRGAAGWQIAYHQGTPEPS